MMINFCIPQIKAVLPILEECYGFKIHEISSELSKVYDKHIHEERLNKELVAKCSYEENGHRHIRVTDYVLETDDKMTIPTTKDFKEKSKGIISLCKEYFERDEETYKKNACILVFMAAILNRDQNELCFDCDMDEINWNIDTYNRDVRPDLLRLYIARHKGKTKYHKSCYVKFGYTAEAVEIQTQFPWFEKALDHYLYKYLGVKDVEEAQKELQNVYGERVGAKLDKKAARYIWGTYHFSQTTSTIKSRSKNSVTNKQSRFIHKYLEILELIDPIDVEPISIRGRLNHLLKQYNSIEELLNEHPYKDSPNNDNYLKLF